MSDTPPYTREEFEEEAFLWAQLASRIQQILGLAMASRFDRLLATARLAFAVPPAEASAMLDVLAEDSALLEWYAKQEDRIVAMERPILSRHAEVRAARLRSIARRFRPGGTP